MTPAAEKDIRRALVVGAIALAAIAPLAINTYWLRVLSTWGSGVSRVSTTHRSRRPST